MSHKFVLILNLMPAADSKTLGQAYVFNEERYCLEVNLHISFSSNGIDVDQCLPDKISDRRHAFNFSLCYTSSGTAFFFPEFELVFVVSHHN